MKGNQINILSRAANGLVFWVWVLFKTTKIEKYLVFCFKTKFINNKNFKNGVSSTLLAINIIAVSSF